MKKMIAVALLLAGPLRAQTFRQQGRAAPLPAPAAFALQTPDDPWWPYADSGAPLPAASLLPEPGASLDVSLPAAALAPEAQFPAPLPLSEPEPARLSIQAHAESLAQAAALGTAAPSSEESSAFEAGASFDKSRKRSGEAPAPASARSQRYRPPVEWWTIGEKRYESTKQLLASDAGIDGPIKAVYHYRPAKGAPGLRHRLLSIVGGTALGGQVGAVVGLLGMALASMFTLFVFMDTRGPDTSGVYFFSAIGAAVGAAMGYSADPGYAVNGQTRRGTLRRGPDGSLAFETRGTSVDVQAHAEAKVLARAPARRRWYDAFAGAGVVAALAVGSLVPLFMIVWPAMWGGAVADGLAAGTHARSFGVAAGAVAAGYAGAVALWTGINVLGWTASFGWVGVAMLAGTALGLLLGPWVRSSFAYNERMADAEPWWNPANEV